MKAQVIEVKSDGRRGWGGGAYTHAHVITPNGYFLIKGFYREVKQEVKKYKKYLVTYTLYGNGRHREIRELVLNGVEFSVFSPIGSRRRNKFEIYKGGKILLSFKRLPNKWIKEFDDLIKPQCPCERMCDDYVMVKKEHLISNYNL